MQTSDESRVTLTLFDDEWTILEYRFGRLGWLIPANHWDTSTNYYIHVPADSGFQIVRRLSKSSTRTCNWASPPSETFGPFRVGLNIRFNLVRCKLGTGNARISVEKGDARLRPEVNYWEPVRRSWHMETVSLGYYMKYQFISPTTRPSQFPLHNAVNFGTEIEKGLTSAATAWNNANAGITFINDPLTASNQLSHNPDITLQGYWMGETTCGSIHVLACATLSPGTSHRYPHFNKQHIYVKFPPDTRKAWTNQLSVATGPDRGRYYYIPNLMMHEMGHTGGLGHLPPIRLGVMSTYSHAGPRSAPSGMDKSGMQAATEPHTD